MEKLQITPAEVKRVKGQGFLFNNDKQHFSGRIITENGVISSKQLKVISEAAEKFGNGNVALTTRLTVEVTGIEYENIENFKEYLKNGDMVTGGTGPKVRPIVACKGTVCVFGLCDTQGVAADIHKRFFEGYSNVVLPHKFKIAVGGCPNNCVKPDLNDIGLVGQRVTSVDSNVCKSCKKCAIELKCPMEAVKSVDGEIVYDREICNNCSRCIGHCPFNAVSPGQQGFKVYIGGRWGKKTR
ncbi:MAG: 4Fe-4S binding protein, partial [Oscillospiraceae bacterium]